MPLLSLKSDIPGEKKLTTEDEFADEYFLNFLISYFANFFIENIVKMLFVQILGTKKREKKF